MRLFIFNFKYLHDYCLPMNMVLFYLRKNLNGCSPLKHIIYISKRNSSEYASHEHSKFMQKLLNKSAKSKKKWYQPHLAEPTTYPGSSIKSMKKNITEAHRTRVNQLSHVLYDKIAELMNSSEFSEEIVNKQVLVTSVKMQVDLSSIHVYWDSHRSDAEEIETLLLNHANKLRSLLISYHVLGRIPPIIFKKDKSHGDLALLDQLLEIADYGPDYVPSNPHFQVRGYGEIPSRVTRVKDDDVTTELFPSPTLTSIDKSEGVQNTQEHHLPESSSSTSDLPAGKPEESHEDSLTQGLRFRSDIYGLPREKLLRKIVALRDRVKFQPGTSGAAPTSGAATTSDAAPTSDAELNPKKLMPQLDQLLLKDRKGSSKIKQKMLERDVDDF